MYIYILEASLTINILIVPSCLSVFTHVYSILFTHGLHVQSIAKSGLFIFPTCSLFPRHVIRCHQFSHNFSQFASHFPMLFFSCLLRCSAFSQPFPACSSIFEPFSSIFHFPSAFSSRIFPPFVHHFPAIFRNIPSLSTVCFPHRPGLHTLPAGPAAR